VKEGPDGPKAQLLSLQHVAVDITASERNEKQKTIKVRIDMLHLDASCMK